MIALMFFILFIGALGFVGFKLYKKLMGTLEQEEEKEKYVPTTQDRVMIDYARRGIVKLKNGSYACVISVPSINIDLMEYEEKQVVWSQYRQILSAIDFPFQFLQQSRVVDISDYLKKLNRIKRQSENQFVKYQLDFYENYIVDLIREAFVLTKKFYIVIPFDEFNEKKKKKEASKNMLEFSINKKDTKPNQEAENVLDEEKNFKIAYGQLMSRARIIESSFSRLEGVKPKMLNDEEITELFYTSYNKNRSVYQPLNRTKTTSDYYSIHVKKGSGK